MTSSCHNTSVLPQDATIDIDWHCLQNLPLTIQRVLLLWRFKLYHSEMPSKAGYLSVNSWAIRETNWRPECIEEYKGYWIVRAYRTRRI